MITFFEKSKNDSDLKRKVEVEDYERIIATLTPRELKVYNQVIQGYNETEMNKELNLTESTIKSYLKSILKKLKVNSKVELILKYGSIYNSVNNINKID